MKDVDMALISDEQAESSGEIREREAGGKGGKYAASNSTTTSQQ